MDSIYFDEVISYFPENLRYILKCISDSVKKDPLKKSPILLRNLCASFSIGNINSIVTISKSFHENYFLKLKLSLKDHGRLTVLFAIKSLCNP